MSGDPQQQNTEREEETPTRRGREDGVATNGGGLLAKSPMCSLTSPS